VLVVDDYVHLVDEVVRCGAFHEEFTDGNLEIWRNSVWSEVDF